MKTITAHLQSLPPQTPPGAALFLAGNINGWQPDDERFRFQPKGDGTWGLTFRTELETLEYKITRGRWSAAEGDIEGRERPDRTYRTSASDSELWVRVESWIDLHQPGKPHNLPDNMLLLHPDFQMPQLGRKRRIWACLPPDYWANPQRRYPVVYMQDGQNLFDNPEAVFGSWGIDKALNRLFLSENAASFSPIIIGIENGAEHRVDEYSPWRNARYGGGEGDLYLDFLCKTLKPFVDGQLRTLPGREHTCVIGSSMGGLISLCAAIKKPDVFGMAGVFSPALWFSGEVYNTIKNRPPAAPVKILLMAGQQESDTMVADLLELYETLLEAGHPDASLHYDLHSDGVHSEWFWAREFEHALRWLFGETPGHTHGITDGFIRFEVDKMSKELLVRVSPQIREPRLEVRDYCHDRQFHHPLDQADNRISYAAWEHCIYSLRVHSSGDLVFSRKVEIEH